ncbi:MAG TPA: cation diffusion facilitator family transporter [Acidiferrobacteraceae bacterium]|nr:cation diffusion facilitator family transporter [Acidiferrobacteraceae bacterium]
MPNIPLDSLVHWSGAGVGQDRRYQQTRRAIVAGMGVNLAVSLLQILFGWVGASAGLIAGGFESLADLITDTLILVAARHAAKAADEDHPYGHARIETAATVGLGLALMLLGGALAARGGLLLSAHSAPTPSRITLAIAGLTIASKEGLYRYLLRVSRKLESNLLRASAWHYRSDAFSSVVIALGIGGAILGVRYLDAVAAIGVALFIVKTGAGLAWTAARELVDTGLEADKVARMQRVILAVPGVRTLHRLRTRRAGALAFVDVHILVDPLLSVSEGHQISEAVRARVIQQMDGVADVIVHIDPEDDETEAPSTGLPLREALLSRLQPQLAALPGADQIQRFTFHYLGGGVRVEILLAAAAPAALAQRLRAVVGQDPDVREVSVWRVAS